MKQPGSSYDYDIRIYSSTSSSPSSESALGSAVASGVNGAGANELCTISVSTSYYYYIKVYRGGGTYYSSTLKYLLRTVVYPMDASDNNFGNAKSISNNTTKTGYLNEKDQANFYYFNLTSSNSVSVSLTGVPSGCDYDLYLYNGASESSQIKKSTNGTGSSESISAGVLPPGKYYIKAQWYSGYSISTYSLKYTASAPPADDAANDINSATLISLSSSSQVTIINKKIDYAGDLDYFKFTAPVSGKYTITSGGSTDVKGTLYSSNKSYLKADDDSNGNRQFKIEYDLTSGQTYYILVQYYNDTGTGAYSLNITKPPLDDHANTAASTTSTLSLGVAMAGNIETAGDVDYFKFTPTSTGIYAFYTLGSTDTKGYLYNSSSASASYIGYNDDGDSGTNFKIKKYLTANTTYYVKVTHYSTTSTGAYTLYVSKVTATTVSLTPAEPAVAGSIAFYDDLSYYTFTVPSSSSGTYTFQSDSTMSMTLYNSSLSSLKTASGSFVYSLSAGSTYYLTAQKTSTTAKGSFTLKIIKPILDPYKTALEVNILTNYNGVSGSISVPGEWDYYKFKAPVTGTYTIQTKGSTDTYGYLISDILHVTEKQNDDAGEGVNFRISHNIYANDWFYVVVRHFNTSSTGSYTLYINFDDDNKREIAIFQFGNEGTNTAINTFEASLNLCGYQTNVKHSNVSGTVPTSSNIRSYGDNADILILKGHGRMYANMPVLANTSMSYDAPSSFFCAQTSVIPSSQLGSYPSTQIGAEFKSGSSTKTTSYWNNDLDWAIFFPCAQLNYGIIDVWNGLDASQVWARTMLGDGNRMNGILGYANIAPGDVDGIITRFLGEAIPGDTHPRTLISAWKTANEPWYAGDSDWAAIVHRENANDSFPFMSGGTNSGDSYIIDRYSWRGDNAKIPLTNAAFTSTQMTHNDDMFTFTSSSHDYTLTNIAQNKASSSVQKANKVARDIEHFFIKPDDNSSTKEFSISNDGKIAFTDYAKDFTKQQPTTMTKANAVLKAVELLSDMGLMPEKDYMVSVSTVIRQVIDTDNIKENPIGVEEIMAYEVKIIHTINSLPVFSRDYEGINLTITADGVSDFSYNWTDLINVIKSSGISSDQLFNYQLDEKVCRRYTEDFLSSWDTKDYSHQIYTTNAMVLEDNKLIPVLLFDIGSYGTNRVAYNAVTGDVIQ